MKLIKDDLVIGMLCVSKDHLILTVTENGYGKRTRLEEYRLTRRGAQGVINIKTTARNGNVVSIMEVAAQDDLIIIARGGKIIRIGADKVRATGRSAQGVRLVNLEEGDQIAAACVVPEANGGDEDGANGQGVLIQ